MNWTQLAIGDCVADADDNSNGDGLQIVDCRTPHVEQLTGGFNVLGDAAAAYPGDAVIEAIGDARCRGMFERFVGISYDNYGATPTAGAMGQLVLLCLLIPIGSWFFYMGMSGIYEKVRGRGPAVGVGVVTSGGSMNADPIGSLWGMIVVVFVITILIAFVVWPIMIIGLARERERLSRIRDHVEGPVPLPASHCRPS